MSRGSGSACRSRGHVHIRTHSLPDHPKQLSSLGLSVLYLPWPSSHLLLITASLSPTAFLTVGSRGTVPANTLFPGIFIIKIRGLRSQPQRLDLCSSWLKDFVKSFRARSPPHTVSTSPCSFPAATVEGDVRRMRRMHEKLSTPTPAVPPQCVF